MQYRPLGQTGINVAPLSLGTVKLGRNQGVKYPQPFELPTDKELRDLLALARELGINLLDTAPAYGSSEERLGKMLRGQREDWLLCTKVGEEFIQGESSYDFSAQHTRLSIERSLKRLQTDSLDIVLVHSNGEDIKILQQTDAFPTLAQLKKEGKIRAWGMSTKTVQGGILTAQQSDLVMVTYNPWQQEEKPVLDFCHEHHVGVLIKKALASGHLGTTHPTDSTLSVQDPITYSFQTIFQHPAITSVITGTLNPSHLRANVKAIQKVLSFSP